MFMIVWSACVSVDIMYPGVPGAQKKMLDALELKLQVAANAGNRNRVSYH